MPQARKDSVETYRVSQAIAALYSFFFFAFIAYGYYYLLVSINVGVAFLAAMGFALLACFLAKMVGSTENGLRRLFPLFVLLFIISGSGIFNSFLLQFEGDRIVAESASAAQDRFSALQLAAEKRRVELGVNAREDKVAGLTRTLVSELRNPMNCGQGPEALRLIGELQRELPGFQPLSNPGTQCGRVEEVIADYTNRIDELRKTAPWANPELTALIADIKAARGDMARLQAAASSEYSPGMIRQAKQALDAANERYRDQLFRLSQQTSTATLPPALGVSAVQNLGDPTKLIPLILDRLDRMTTWIYFGIAVGFDWLMVYLFGLVRQSRVRKPAASVGIAGAW